MRRTLRSAACSAALVGLSALLGACDAVAPTAVAPESAPAASLSARVGQVQQERLREAGRPGLKRGVNYAPPAQQQAVVESKASPGTTRNQSAPAFRVQNLRLGEAALRSAEQMGMYRAKGGEAFGRTGTTGEGDPGEVGVTNWQPWWYEGQTGSSMGPWFPQYAWLWSVTTAEKNITYIDLIADFYDSWYHYTVYEYSENASWASAMWQTWVSGSFWLYVTHYVYDEDGYGTYSGSFNSWIGSMHGVMQPYMYVGRYSPDPCYPYGCPCNPYEGC